MYSSIISDIRRAFHSNMLSKLVIVNVAAFLLIGLVWFIGMITHAQAIQSAYQEIVNQLGVTESFMQNLRKPWTYVSYMFMHSGIFHLVWNMILFVWFGRIIGDFLGDRRILPIYLMGGLSGVIFLMLVAAITNLAVLNNVLMVGASASVMAFAMAAATLSPDYSYRLLFFGDIRLKYIVLALLIIDVVYMSVGNNVAGHLSHFGGAIFGWAYIVLLRRGTDLTEPLQKFFKIITDKATNIEARGHSRIKKRVLQGEEYQAVNRSQQKSHDEHQLDFEERLDNILEKIKKKGYDNLEYEEKEFLNKASNKQD